MPGVNLYLLGQFHYVRDDQPVMTEFRSDKARALLAYLVLEGTRPVPRDQLAHLLWEGYAAKTARASLRVTLSNLRAILEPLHLLRTTNQTVCFQPDPTHFWCDAMVLDALPQPAPDRAPPAQQSLLDGLQLGEFLADFDTIDSHPFRAWLQQRRLFYKAQQARWFALSQLQKQSNGAINLAGQLAQIPSNRWELQNAPLIPPKDVIALREDIVHGATSPQRRISITHNLVLPTNAFVGRSTELAQIAAALNDPAQRVITLVGSGGVGKSRLALEAVRPLLNSQIEERITQLPQAFLPDDGVYFVHLAAAHDWRATLPVVIAGAMKLPLQPGLLGSQLTAYLRTRQILIVLDHCRWAADAVAYFTEFLAAAPRLKFLATGHAPLGLPGETVIRVERLVQHDRCGCAGEQQGDRCGCTGHQLEEQRRHDAVTLFHQRMATARADDVAKRDNDEHVRQLCWALHGLPLSIEVAATFFHDMDIATLVAYMDHQLAKTAAGSEESKDEGKGEEKESNGVERPLMILLNLLWASLQKREKQVLLYLSVFEETFSHQAAIIVGMTSARQLQGLINQSLIREVAPNRYLLADMIRAYLVAKRQAEVAVDHAAWHRFTSYFANQLFNVIAENEGEVQSAMAVLHEDWHNLQCAWQWAQSEQKRNLLDRLQPGMTAISKVWALDPLPACRL